MDATLGFPNLRCVGKLRSSRPQPIQARVAMLLELHRWRARSPAGRELPPAGIEAGLCDTNLLFRAWINRARAPLDDTQGATHSNREAMSLTRSIFMHMFGRPEGYWGGWAVLSWRARMRVAALGLPIFLKLDRTTACWKWGSAPESLFSACQRSHRRVMSPGSIRRMRWWSKPALGTEPPSRAVVSTCGAALLRACHSDKALTINSMQVWPDPAAGLREMRRVMKPGVKIALGFTPYSGQSNEGLTQYSRPLALGKRAWWREITGSVRWR